MIRVLTLVAGVGLVVSIACFVGMSVVGGPELFHGTWSRSLRIHDGSITVGHDYTPDSDGGGPAETRTIAWNGDDSLELDIPADVQFTQAPGPGKLVITGPKGTVDQVELSGSKLDFKDEPSNAGHVTIVMTAPNVTRFSIDSDGTIGVAGYDQDELDLDMSGDGQFQAAGKTHRVKLSISGDGGADLAQLVAEDAQVDIGGDGHATIAPTISADLNISGDGEINLASHPATVRSSVSGDGRINQGVPTAQSSSRERP